VTRLLPEACLAGRIRDQCSEWIDRRMAFVSRSRACRLRRPCSRNGRAFVEHSGHGGRGSNRRDRSENAPG